MSYFGDVAGWLLFAASFLVVLPFREFRRDGRLVLLFWTAIIARQVLALRAAYIAGLAFDALAFQLQAERLLATPWKLGVGEHFYGPFLALFYKYLGTSAFLGIQLSVLAFALASVLFLKLIAMFDLLEFRFRLYALFALLPSSLMFTSATMREGFQVLYFIGAVYFGLRFRASRSPLMLVASATSALLMGFLHNGLIALAPIVVSILAIWRIRDLRIRPGFLSRNAILMVVLAIPMAIGAIGFVYAIRAKVNGAAVLQALGSRHALEAARRYREGGMEITARTTYGVELETSSAGALAKSGALIVVYYMAAPFPWQVRTPVDAYGFMEVVLRLVLLAASLATWYRLRGPPRRVVTILLVIYAGAVCMWAIGTVNYGTALRHHYTTTWILMLLGGPRAMAWGRGFLRRLQAVPPAPATA